MPQCPDFREMCVEAQRTGTFDLQSGMAHLEGDVVGVLRSQGIRFASDALDAYRNEAGDWERVVLDGSVRVVQPGEQRAATAGHAVLQRERLALAGAVWLTEPGLEVRAEEVEADRSNGRTVLRAREGERVLIERRPPPAADGGQAPEDGEEPDGMAVNDVTVRARTAVLEEGRRTMELSGDVFMEQHARDMLVTAEQLRLEFAADDSLRAFYAQGDVRIQQPERVITADQAQSRNNMETILLMGNANMQQGENFSLSSERMEVYTDSERGLVESGDDSGQPITFSLDTGTGYRLNQATLDGLEGEGVPAPVRRRLQPLLGQRYGGRDAFAEAVRGRLTPVQAARHLDTIVAAAAP